MQLRRLFSLAAAVMLFPVAAFAQGTSLGWGGKMPVVAGSNNPGAVKVGIVGGVNPSDTSGVPLQLNTDGSLKVSEENPPSCAFSYQPSVISAVFVANATGGWNEGGMLTHMDSTTAIDCRGYNRGALLMFPSATALNIDRGNGSADSLAGGLFALEVRGHPTTATDSLNTYRIPAQLLKQAVASAAVTQFSDTVGSLADISHYSASAAALEAQRYSHERLIVVGNITKANRGMVIWTNQPGTENSAMMPFMSWRLRYLESYNMVGVSTPAATATDLHMRVRCDLILWRE